AIISAQPDFQPRLLARNLGGGDVPALVQGLSQRSVNFALPVKDAATESVGRFGDRTTSESGTSQRIEDGSVLPSPRVSAALAVLPPFDLSGLEMGMQEFVKNLERLAPYLTGDREGTEMWPWIVAVAAAAAACEIARRELSRPPDLPTVEKNGI